jgi:hypothetical protein
MEVMVVSAMLVGVSGAMLTALAEFDDNAKTKTQQNEAQQEARRGLDRLASELRNLASPTNEQPDAVEKATATDLVFQSIAAVKPPGSQNARNARRVRYCLDSVTPAARIWRQEQTWTTSAIPAMPATSACPEAPASGGWSEGLAMGRDVVNGADRALFAYNSGDLKAITEIGVKLYVDTTPGKRPAEAELQSGVFLRNQNRGPTASFTATPSGSQIVLNGSASSDPEGKSLSYKWYDADVAISGAEAIVYTYNASPGNHPIKLKVTDPAGLSHTAAPQTVCIPGPDWTC